MEAGPDIVLDRYILVDTFFNSNFGPPPDIHD
jgi:hypothetical protein